MIRSLTNEQWADAVTRGLLTLMWAVMLFFELRRTWRWDSLGRSLTVLTGCLLVSYGIGTVTLVTTLDIWRPEIRWITRVVLFSAGVSTIVVLVRDRPPVRDGAQ